MPPISTREICRIFSRARPPCVQYTVLRTSGHNPPPTSTTSIQYAFLRATTVPHSSSSCILPSIGGVCGCCQDPSRAGGTGSEKNKKIRGEARIDSVSVPPLLLAVGSSCEPRDDSICKGFKLPLLPGHATDHVSRRLEIRSVRIFFFLDFS